jgi:hypothetical protein
MVLRTSTIGTKDRRLPAGIRRSTCSERGRSNEEPAGSRRSLAHWVDRARLNPTHSLCNALKRRTRPQINPTHFTPRLHSPHLQHGRLGTKA